MKNSLEKINFFLNILTVTIAVAGIFIAISANRKADEANQIARESNQLTITSLNANVQVKHTKWTPIIYTCVNPLTGTYLTFDKMESDILVTNSGGNTTSLVNAKGYSPDDNNWYTAVYSNVSLSEQVSLPFDIPSGSSRQFWIVSFALLSSGKTLDTLTPNKSVPYNPFYWEIEFGNGQVIKIETSTFLPKPTWETPEKCVYTNTNFP